MRLGRGAGWDVVLAVHELQSPAEEQAVPPSGPRPYSRLSGSRVVRCHFVLTRAGCRGLILRSFVLVLPGLRHRVVRCHFILTRAGCCGLILRSFVLVCPVAAAALFAAALFSLVRVAAALFCAALFSFARVAAAALFAATLFSLVRVAAALVLHSLFSFVRVAAALFAATLFSLVRVAAALFCAALFSFARVAVAVALFVFVRGAAVFVVRGFVRSSRLLSGHHSTIEFTGLRSRSNRRPPVVHRGQKCVVGAGSAHMLRLHRGGLRVSIARRNLIRGVRTSIDSTSAAVVADMVDRSVVDDGLGVNMNVGDVNVIHRTVVVEGSVIPISA